MRSNPAKFAVASLYGASLLLGACGEGGKTIIEPPPVGSEDFVLTIRIESAEAALAQQLGWTNGIPTAEVTVVAANGSAGNQTITTAANGSAVLKDLPVGKYRISVRRLLDAQEIGNVPGSDLMAFVASDSFTVAADLKNATITALASRRGTILISEWALKSKLVTGVGSYRFAGYLELYNNSDAPVFLDGIRIAEGLSDPVENPNFSCASLAPFRNDTAGAWSAFIAAVPGAGTQYPLAPGEVAVIAIDAIDHRAVSEDLPDLRSASFEFFGEADIDNPQVPNMIYEGLSPYPLGHGISFVHSVLAAVTLVTSPLQIESLARGTTSTNNSYLRLPVARIIDAFSSRNTFERDPALGLIPCPQLVHASVDRKEGFFLEADPADYTRSANRKVLATLPTGRVVLQHTRSSALDYKTGNRTPGSVNKDL